MPDSLGIFGYVDMRLDGNTLHRFFYGNCQKTREGCGCFRDLFRVPEENCGKIPGKCWKNVPKSLNALNSRISGTGKGKAAANLGPTLPGPCPTFRTGCFFEIDSYSLRKFSLGTNLCDGNV